MIVQPLNLYVPQPGERCRCIVPHVGDGAVCKEIAAQSFNRMAKETGMGVADMRLVWAGPVAEARQTEYADDVVGLPDSATNEDDIAAGYPGPILYVRVYEATALARGA